MSALMDKHDIVSMPANMFEYPGEENLRLYTLKYKCWVVFSGEIVYPFHS